MVKQPPDKRSKSVRFRPVLFIAGDEGASEPTCLTYRRMLGAIPRPPITIKAHNVR